MVTTCQLYFKGSSPRVRGAAKVSFSSIACQGIIPARAGSSLHLPRLAHEGWDHPRACGEQLPSGSISGVSQGSSPRVRGAAIQSRRKAGLRGIIPARAGSRKDEVPYKKANRDHPRACGEQLVPHEPMKPSMGSSPRVRGAVPGLRQAKLHHGIIPARAGSSS